MMMNIVSLEIQAESTLSNSFESGFTVESLSCDADSKLDVWTNERHNSYLDGLESSFVRQLQSLLGGETQRVYTTTRKSTNQLRVLQSKCLHKVKKQAHLGTSLEFNSLCNTMGTTVSCKLGLKKCGSKANFTRTPVRNSLRREYPVQNTTEVRGKSLKEEEEKERVSEVIMRSKRDANYDDSSLNDQVVP